VLGITVVALPLLAACGTGPQQSVTCYGNGTHSLAADDACRRAALIALRQAPRGEVLAAAAEVWQGPCFPGAFCGPVSQPGPPAWNAVVGLRITGSATSLTDVTDLAWSPSVAPLGGIDPERFIDMILGTRGAWVVTVPKA
jgi:hypothetical protein